MALMSSTHLYIHTPFCLSKCPYCHFNSLPGSIPGDYAVNLLREWQKRSSKFGQEFATIYLGGGSPALIPRSEWQKVLSVFPRKSNSEITLEINPELVEKVDWKGLIELGINRVILGAQAWHDDELKALGRNTTVWEIYRSWEYLKLNGPLNLGIDLIYAIPGQNLASWEESLKTTLTTGAKHLSLYELDLTGKHWQRRKPYEKAIIQMYELAHELLTGAGYIHYEVSNFALPSYFARHNMGVWQGEDYVGLGSGAHGRIGNRRYANAAFPDCWAKMLAKDILPEKSVWQMSNDEAMVWDAILGLRTSRGITPELWQHVARKEFAEELRNARLLVGNQRVHLTLNGWLVSNRIFGELLERNVL